MPYIDKILNLESMIQLNLQILMKEKVKQNLGMK